MKSFSGNNNQKNELLQKETGRAGNIIYVPHNKIDFKKWDNAILRSELPLVFAQSFYLNATSPGWSAFVEGDYKSVMPVPAKKKYGIEYVMQPPFTSQLGVYGDVNENIVLSHLGLLKKKYRYIDVELNAANNFKIEGARDKRTFMLDTGEESFYNSNTKRNIARAKKLNLYVEGVREDQIPPLSKKYINPFLKNKLKIKQTHIAVFDALIKKSIEQGFLATFIVKDEEGKICAMAHYISNGKHALYLKGTNFDRNSGSMHFLMDHAIGFFKDKKVKFFDFGGGQSDSLAQFYMGFGSRQVNYKIFKVNNLPPAIKWLKK